MFFVVFTKTELLPDLIMANQAFSLSSEAGVPRSLRSERQPNPENYKIVSVRMREAEFVSFAEHASAAGLTNNMALRIAARRIGGFLEIDEETRHCLQEISRHIGHIAASLAVLRRMAREEDVINTDVLKEQRLAFGQEFARLDPLLQQLLNVSKRRRDGRAMLIDASQSQPGR